jgi:hypothetical protein
MGYQNFLLFENTKAQLRANTKSHQPIFKMPFQKGVNQIQAEFTLPAPLGSFYWQSYANDVLSGVQLFIIPKEFPFGFQWFWVSWNMNIFPARIVGMPSSFRRFESPDPFSTVQPGLARVVRTADTYVLMSPAAQNAYPCFWIQGVMPHRAFLIGMVFFFVCITVGVLFFFRKSLFCKGAPYDFK